MVKVALSHRVAENWFSVQLLVYQQDHQRVMVDPMLLIV